MADPNQQLSDLIAKLKKENDEFMARTGHQLKSMNDDIADLDKGFDKLERDMVGIEQQADMELVDAVAELSAGN